MFVLDIFIYIMSNIKNFFVSAVSSLGKFQENIGQNINGVNNEISLEQQVRKREIKLLSKSRFYEIMENSEIVKKLNSLGIPATKENIENYKNLPPRCFKNERYGELMEDINGNEETARYKFRASNIIYRYASHVNLMYNDGHTFLEFVINKIHYPQTVGIDFSNLNYFEVIENAKTYGYEITGFIGGRVISPYENGLIFEGNVVINGIHDFDMDDSNVILNSVNTPPKNTVHYG